MHTITTTEQIREFERTRALVGTYVDHMYSSERLEWVLRACRGFDEHVGSAFHLLIPHRDNGYTVDVTSEKDYGLGLARKIINHQKIEHRALPCIVFRASDEHYYFLKLGHRDKDDFLEIVGRIGDLAIECARDGPADPEEFRKRVNKRTVKFLRRQRALSALASALPALSALLGFVVSSKDLF